MKPLIAVDIDDVLAIENEAVRLFSNERYGHVHLPEDYLKPGPYWGYWETIQGVDRAEGKRRYREYLDSGLKSRLLAHSHALAVLSDLKLHYRLAIVTSREAELMDVTHVWLDANFPDVFEGVEFVDVWSDKKASKGDVCRRIGASYLIDDNLDHCEAALKEELVPLLFGAYGWNTGVSLPESIVRVTDWLAIKEFFDARR